MSRAEQVAQAERMLVVEAVLDAQSRRPGAVYNRVVGTFSTGHREWEVDVTIYPLLWGRFRVAVGPGGKDDDGGFDWYEDRDDWDSAYELAEGITRRRAQEIRAGRR